MTLALALFAGLLALGWSAVACKVVASARAISFLVPLERNSSLNEPSVDVIVPAHNEERDIEATVRCIAAQEYPSFRITIVDDHSIDRTAAILERLAQTLPIEILASDPRPDGWVGKTWAVDQAAQKAQADWLLFVDGDMGLHPRALATAMYQAGRAEADLVSIIARPTIRSFWQGAVALAVGEVLFTLYPLDKVNSPERKEALAAGGFVLVRRATYEAVGGHRAVKSEIVEDIQLARTIKSQGGRLSVHLAPDLVWTHMYGSFGEIWRGLRKNAYAGMEYYFHKFVVGGIVTLVMIWVPILTTLYGLWKRSPWLTSVGAWGWLAETASVAPAILFLRINPLFLVAFPMGVTAYVAITCSSVWHHYQGRIVWKDVTFAARDVERASYRSEEAKRK